MPITQEPYTTHVKRDAQLELDLSRRSASFYKAEAQTRHRDLCLTARTAWGGVTEIAGAVRTRPASSFLGDERTACKRVVENQQQKGPAKRVF
jgi:hypothetical protein